MWKNRYNFLLLVVVVHLIALGLELPIPWTEFVNLAVTVIGATLLLRITKRRQDLWTLLVLGCAGSILNLLLPWDASPVALNLLKVGFWSLAPAFLAQRVFVTIYDADAITHAEIAGAIAIYLLIALVFATVYEAAVIFNPESIAFGPNFDAEGAGFGGILYFSFITLSTLGFGDVAPATTTTRLLVVIESVTGVMYMAILVARFVSLQSADRLRRKML